MPAQQQAYLTTAYLTAVDGTPLVGKVLCFTNATIDRFTVATTASLALYGQNPSCIIIATNDVSDIAVEVQQVGWVPNSVTGLGPGSAGNICVNATGALARGSSPLVVGTCDALGNAQVNFAGVGVGGVVTPPGGTTGQVQYNNSGAFGGLAHGAVGAVLRQTGATTSAFGALDLADSDARTGVLPAANGGTGLSAVGTTGNVLTSNGTVWVSSAPASSELPLLTVTASGTINNLDLTNYGGAIFTGEASGDLTGIVAVADGRVRKLLKDDSYNLTLKHGNTGSSAGNRFRIPLAVDWVVKDGVTVTYTTGGNDEWVLTGDVKRNYTFADLSGTLGLAQGGTGQNFSSLTGNANKVVRVNNGETALELATLSGGGADDIQVRGTSTGTFTSKTNVSAVNNAIKIGGNEATAGHLRLPTAGQVCNRNNANSADCTLITKDSSDRCRLGSDSANGTQCANVRLAPTTSTEFLVNGSFVGEVTSSTAQFSGNIECGGTYGGYSAGSTPYRLKSASITQSSTSDTTLSAAQYSSGILAVTGTPGGNFNLIGPNTGGTPFLIYNGTANTLTIKKSGGTGGTIATGLTKWAFHDGTDYRVHS